MASEAEPTCVRNAKARRIHANQVPQASREVAIATRNEPSSTRPRADCPQAICGHPGTRSRTPAGDSKGRRPAGAPVPLVIRRNVASILRTPPQFPSRHLSHSLVQSGSRPSSNPTPLPRTPLIFSREPLKSAAILLLRQRPLPLVDRFNYGLSASVRKCRHAPGSRKTSGLSHLPVANPPASPKNRRIPPIFVYTPAVGCV